MVGKAAEMVIRNDTVEYNPGGFQNTRECWVEDLLKKLPGVEVGKRWKDNRRRKTGKENPSRW